MLKVLSDDLDHPANGILVMQSADVQKAKTRLDAQLQGSAGYIGIAFGADLYEALWKLGHIQMGPFSAVGFPSVVLNLPTYGVGRHAFCDPELPADSFLVGKAA